jgi:hypothetical protein
MKSITIKDAITGKKLIKVFHNKEGYFVESRSDIASFDCLIITDEKERITVPIRRAL